MEYAPLDYQDENPIIIFNGLPSTNSLDNIPTNELLNKPAEMIILKMPMHKLLH